MTALPDARDLTAPAAFTLLRFDDAHVAWSAFVDEVKSGDTVA
ncbi:hypothetical protein [Streptomyces sp. NPDC002215]